MDLRRSLALAFAEAHPADAATVLEARPPDETAHTLTVLPAETAARVLQHMVPAAARSAIDQLEPAAAAGILAPLAGETIATLLRRTLPERRESILSSLPAELARHLRTIVGYPVGTAGALMDPRAIALPGDLSVKEALQAVQRDSEHALYNLYVVDRKGMLVGVMNLQELLHARGRDRLDTLMHAAVHRLVVSADQRSIVDHPGWREVYSLPVVDDAGRFQGALRYRTLRRVEAELREVDPTAAELTAGALGDLFWTGIAGVIDALSTSVVPRPAPKGRTATRAEEREEPERA